jgi:hypothetical protein
LPINGIEERSLFSNPKRIISPNPFIDRGSKKIIYFFETGNMGRAGALLLSVAGGQESFS